ncbi:MAG: 50S ribosomal protein L4 [Mycoplasmoidaceae bacterium]|nr:50S ribosomal protein L4 [Mycoplasmoidaceae bacterium]
MAKLNIIDLSNKSIGEVEVRKEIAEAKVAKQALFDEIIAEQAGKRQGTHSTLTKAEVRGGGKKPVPQKHTGNARQGSIRNPHYVGGGVVFGPKPNRNYRHKVNKKVSQLALISALNQRVKDIIILDNAAVEKAKTKDYAKLLKTLKITDKRTLFVFCPKHKKAIMFTRNINKADAKLVEQVSVVDILKAKKLIFCANAAKAMLGGK